MTRVQLENGIMGSTPRAGARGTSASEPESPLLDALWLAPVGIALLDRGLRFVRVNEAFARLTGIDAAAHAGKAPRELFPGRDDVARAAEERLRAVVDSGEPALDAPLSTRAADGSPRSWRASCYPVFTMDGEVGGICAVVEETTRAYERERALERARATADASARRLALLQGITAALSAAMDPADIGGSVVERVRAAAGADAASIRTLEREGLVALAAQGLRADFFMARVVHPEAPVPTADALRRERAVWLESLEAIGDRYPDVLALARFEGFEAFAALPLRARGRVFGSLSLMFREPRAFDLEERAFVSAIAEQCAQALDRARLSEGERAALAEVRSAAERLATLQAVTAALSHARTPREVAEVVVDRATAVLGANVAVAYFLDAARATLSLQAHRGLTDEEVSRYGTLPLDAGFPATAAVRTGEASWLASWGEVEGAYPEIARLRPDTWGVGALAVVPLRAGGAILGSLALWFRAARRFEPVVRDLVASIADQCGQALERARLFEAERTQRAALDAFLENAPLGIGLFDRELRFVRVNPVLAAMNGASVEAHAGRSPAEILPTIAWDEIAEGMRRVMETGVPRLEVPVVVPGENGEVRHFLEAWYPVRTEGETTGLGAIIREVTAEREAEEFQRHVVGIVGHDLRTPLATVATAAQLLARGEPLTERQARIVAQLRAGAARLDQITRVLLDYTQARAGRGIPVRAQRCDLAALCRAVAEECAAARPGRTVHCGGEGDATAECDSDRLGQALANLVSNALDYSPRDSAVDVRWRAGPEEVAISVTNAGAPIPPDVLPRIFEPFRQGAKERDARRGLGLGLFIARAIVTAHGGRIDVRSDAGGTEFTIRVPRRTA